MSGPPRYAIYHVPAADTALYRFGAALLGYDAIGAGDVDHPPSALGLFADWHALTAEPRSYGFHATLKAPFSLAEGRTEQDLAQAFERFTQAPRAIPLIVPRVQSMDGFIAVVPELTAAPLAQLAGDCVVAFEPFRAPLTGHDRQRRLQSPLTPRQIEHLDCWGYPYVFEEFRFHMTLTGHLREPTHSAALQFLQAEFAGLGLTSHPIGHIALLRQERRDARFVVLRQAPLVPA